MKAGVQDPQLFLHIHLPLQAFFPAFCQTFYRKCPVLPQVVSGAFAFVGIAALQLFNVFTDQQIKYPVAIGASKPAVFDKFFICRPASGANYLMGLLLLVLLPDAQQAGQQLPQRELTVKNSGIRAKIHLFGTLGTKMVLRLYAIDHLGILDIGFPDFASLT